MSNDIKYFERLLASLDNTRHVKIAQRPTWDTNQEELFKLADIVSKQLAVIQKIYSTLSSMYQKNQYSAPTLLDLASGLVESAKQLDKGNSWTRLDYISLTEPGALRNFLGLSQDVEDVFNKYSKLLQQAAISYKERQPAQTKMRTQYVLKGLATNIEELRQMYKNFSGLDYQQPDQKSKQPKQEVQPKQEPKSKPGRDMTRQYLATNDSQMQTFLQSLQDGDYVIRPTDKKKFTFDAATKQWK